MAEILETVMLACFGFSWPINLIKNYRAGTARNMSLSFILLIFAGYMAGIAAKLIAGKLSFVLAVYVLNLLMVGGNLAVYFINRKKDEQADR